MKNKKQKGESEKQEPTVDKQPISVFGGNADVKKTRNYSFRELILSRKKFYILCCSLLGVSVICTAVTYSLREQRSYKDYPSLIVKNAADQFNMTGVEPDIAGQIDNDYYLYYYTSTCGACESLAPSIFAYVENIAMSADPLLLYFAQLDSLYNTDDLGNGELTIEQYQNSLLGVSSSAELVAVFAQNYYTPTLLRVRDGQIQNSFVGGEEILLELELRDYNNYAQIATVENQLSQDESDYYLYYFDSSAESRDYKRSIFNYLDRESHKPLYFVNSEVLALIDETVAVDANNGINEASEIKIKHAPFMLQVAQGVILNSYSTASSIGAELGISDD